MFISLAEILENFGLEFVNATRIPNRPNVINPWEELSVGPLTIETQRFVANGA